MPRSGWIAVGAVIAALGSEIQTGTRGAVAILLLAAAWSIGWGMVRVVLRPPATRGGEWVHGITLVGVGALLVAGRLALAPIAAPPQAGGVLPGGDGPWTGTVLTVGAPKSGAQSAEVQLAPPVGFAVAATLPVYPVVVPGDIVSMTGSLRPPSVGDSYADYLARIGASATIRAASVTVQPPSDDVGRRLEGLRREADAALRTSLPEPEAGLASGILIGLRDRVDRDLTAAFTTVGATHVVAISGWNIAIVASSLAALAGRLARRRRMALTAVAIAAYVVFVGPSPSVLRAAAMAGVVMAARELGRPSRAAAAIGWAVAGLLVVSPPIVEDPGFRLSALATVGLIAWGTPLTERLAGPSPGRLRAWLSESLGVSLAAQLATLPVVVISFGRLSIVSPVVNLGVVPLVAPAMAAGALALVGGILVLGGLPTMLGIVLGMPAWVLFSIIVGLVRSGAGIPFASLQLAAPWDAIAAVIAGFAILATMRWLRGSPPGGAPPKRGGGTLRRANPSAMTPEPGSSSRRVMLPAWIHGQAGRGLALGLAMAVAMAAVVVAHRADGIPRLTVLDVGQGDAILVEGNRGGRLLIDGGPDPGRLLVALDEHLPPWDRRIDLVILSHPHEDHAAGLAALLDRYAVRRVLEPGMIGPGPGYAALNAELIARGIIRGTLSTGDRLSVDDIAFQVLWPDSGSVPERPPDGGTGINNVSIVLLGEVEGHRILLAGDIEEQIDPTLLTRGLPQVDVLKVAHHGSRTSSTQAFLDATRPRLAVISAGKGNPYGHPAAATVARLTATGARVFRTDDDGTVTVDLGPGAIHAHASGARPVPTPARAKAAVATALLCGLPPPTAGLLAHVAGARVAGTVIDVADRVRGAAAADTALAVAALSGARSIAPRRPFGPAPASSADGASRLGYASSRDDPDPQRLASAAGGRSEARPGRLLLGRRRLRHRGGGRRLPARSRAVPGRSPRALADPGRNRGCRPPPR